MPSSQRPFFLSSFLAAFHQQPASPLSTAPQPTNKHSAPVSSPAAAAYGPTAAATQQTAAAAAAAAQRPGGLASLHSPRAAVPIPNGAGTGGRRRGSDSSSEGFRDVLGADKWYIGGRTAAGEEKFFKLGVVRRVRSGDRLSLDRLSL